MQELPSSSALDTHLALERAEETRSWRVHLTALLSLPLAVTALWPTLFPEVLRRAVFAFWGLNAVGALGSLWTEWRLRFAWGRRGT